MWKVPKYLLFIYVGSSKLNADLIMYHSLLHINLFNEIVSLAIYVMEDSALMKTKSAKRFRVAY